MLWLIYADVLCANATIMLQLKPHVLIKAALDADGY